MNCRKCNVELAEGALFCPACGERVAQTPGLTEADVQASRDAVRILTERAAELRPEAIQALVADAQAPLREELSGVREELNQVRLEAKRIQTTAANPESDTERTHGFRSFEEFLQVAMLNRGDTRLHTVISAPSEQRDLSMGVGVGGGFLVPPQFAEMLEAITPQEAVVRPRATIIPAGPMPDASVTMPVMNQTGANGVFAGMTGAWIAEGGAKPETQPILSQVKLDPHEVAALVDVTDKLLRNNPGAVTMMVQTGFRDVILAMEDTAFISGNGVGRPLGFLGHASNVNVARTGALAVVYADVINMFWRMLRLGTGNPVWLVHPSTLPQLQGMASPLGQLIWQPSAREGLPSTLLGYPVVINERQPVLGAVGDVMFCNLRYYLIKDGVGISISDDAGISDFRHNITCIKAFRSVDGQPWLAGPLLLEDGVTTTSPFVVLN